jgi:hypothetical protein
MPLVWRRERWLLGSILLMLLLALIGPPVTQPPHYHDFADQRVWCGMPHAMDVLSNLPFAAWGVAGLWALARAVQMRAIDSVSAWLAGLFFAGLIATAGVSSYYHWQPDNAGLVWDRAGMVLAFAGLLGLAGVQAAGRRSGLALAVAVLVGGLAAVQVWAASGNLLPWVVLQGGGMVLILAVACLPGVQPAPSLRIRWLAVIVFYTLAKVLELADHPVFALTSQLVSGHSLKHGVASLSAWPVLLAVLAALRMSALQRQTQGRIGLTLEPARQIPSASAQPTIPRSPA